MLRVAWFGVVCLVLAIAAGCQIEHRSGDFACQTTAECPDTRTCNGGFCVVGGASDGGTDLDATVRDGSSADAPTECPEQCTSCDGNVCRIECETDFSCPEEIKCPPGFVCEVRCDGISSCSGGIQCDTELGCELRCTGPGSCSGRVVCRGGPCEIECEGAQSCNGGLSCRFACSCETKCGFGSCQRPPICPGATPASCSDDSGNCVANRDQCNRCDDV